MLNFKDMCSKIGVSEDNFHKVRKFVVKYQNSLCTICFMPAVDKDDEIVRLRWIGDEQYICCGSQECNTAIQQLDLLHKTLHNISEDKKEA